MPIDCTKKYETLCHLSSSHPDIFECWIIYRIHDVANLKVKNAFLLRNCIHNKYCLLCKGKNIVKYNCDWKINVNWFFWWGKLCQAKKNFISLKTFFTKLWSVVMNSWYTKIVLMRKLIVAFVNIHLPEVSKIYADLSHGVSCH